jgi:hypothetical protein
MAPEDDVGTASATAPRVDWTDEDVARHWDAVASKYVRENDRVKDAHSQRFEVAVPRLALEPHSRVLDISSRDCESEDHIRRIAPEAYVVHAATSMSRRPTPAEGPPEEDRELLAPALRRWRVRPHPLARNPGARGRPGGFPPRTAPGRESQGDPRPQLPSGDLGAALPDLHGTPRWPRGGSASIPIIA